MPSPGWYDLLRDQLTREPDPQPLHKPWSSPLGFKTILHELIDRSYWLVYQGSRDSKNRRISHTSHWLIRLDEQRGVFSIYLRRDDLSRGYRSEKYLCAYHMTADDGGNYDEELAEQVVLAMREQMVLEDLARVRNP